MKMITESVSTLRAAATDEQIEYLMREAGEAGDLEQVALCVAALAGERGARAKCDNVIATVAADIAALNEDIERRLLDRWSDLVSK